ncbi:DHA2 family efflux MFS transporter permease subunit [Kytococcus sp. Marseille-QA3725]
MPTTSAPETVDHPDDLREDHAPILRVLTVATFVVILNETIMVNAIPQLMESLHVSAQAAQWLSTAFMLTMAVVIPTTGWFLHRLDRRSAYATAMGAFTLGTLLCALAPGFGVLLLGRVVQAVGTAIMMPLLMTTAMALVPVEERGRTMGNVSLAISVAPALGPTTSGLVLQVASWRWLFLLVLPLAAVMLVVGHRLLPPNTAGAAGRLDALSLPLAALGFGGLIYGMSSLGGHTGAGAAEPVVDPAVSLVVGLVCVVALVWRQLSLVRGGGSPLLDLRALAHRNFAVAMAVMCAAMIAMMGTMILLPLWLQHARGLSVLQAGLVMMPGGLMMGLLAPLIGRWYDRLGPRPLVVPGAVTVLVSLGAGALAATSGPWWTFVIIHPLVSFGLALMFTPLFTAGLGTLPLDLHSHGSAILGTFQQVAAAAGTALAITVMSARSAQLTTGGLGPSDSLAGGVSLAMGVGAGIFVVALALTFLVRRPEGEPVTL